MFFKDNKRVIPKKNYVYLFLIILFSLMVIYYLYLWHKSYKESLLNTEILSDYLDVINYNELDDYIVENKDAVIYVSVLKVHHRKDAKLDPQAFKKGKPFRVMIREWNQFLHK